MSISKQIKQLRPLVLELLTKNPKYRDSDKMLCARLWSTQLGGVEKLKTLTTYEFLIIFSQPKSKLYNVVSIVRVRRKLQEELPELRGTKYKEKHDAQGNVKRALGYKG
jgi:hypothetical protein